MTNNTAAISSTDSDSDEGLSGVKTPSVLVAKKPGKFEVISIVNCMQVYVMHYSLLIFSSVCLINKSC